MLEILLRALPRGAVAALCLAATPLSAADLALVLGNANYRSLTDIREVEDLRGIARDLADDGFAVVGAFDQDSERLVEAVQEFHRRSADADRILVVLGGHIATGPRDAWLIGTEARKPDLVDISQVGLSLSAVAQIAEASAGRAVILVGPGGTSDALGDGLRTGTRGINLPQGVTLARGTVRDLRRAIFDGLLRDGRSLDDALSRLSARGFLSKAVGFTGQRTVDPVDVDSVKARAEEEGFWNAARALDTETSLQLYLSRYPRGRFASAARARINALQNSEQERWEREEAALDLDRNDRRRIQRQLTLLGYSTRGVDGIFGRGTRAAIRNWQEANGFEETGFLNRVQLRALTRQAERAEAERAAEEARKEEAYWRDTGARGTIDGLRAYLDRYPNGRFARDARARLTQLEAEAAEERAAEARRAWRRARDIDTADAYREFLKRYPDSADADNARARLREFERNDDEELIRKAKNEEREIVKNSLTRLLVEQRLFQLGYRPGVPDGDFTDQTRQALRAFQQDRNIFPSGYVTKRTAGFLLSGR